MAESQAEVIAFLSRAETYDGVSVEIIETHASMVFLAGDYAYKLKKAVRFSYLDYSTPERRRAACEAELTTNRRFAPALYLRVEPIRRDAEGRLRRGGSGAPVDYVVVMRRFDTADQLDHVAEAGRLTHALMTSLADVIAEHHAAAAPRPQFGGARGMGAVIDMTIENLHLGFDGAPEQPQVESWAERAQQLLTAHAALLDARRDAGKVRACHGDLHLQNIALIEGRPVLFDAIEFDPAISSIDILYDLSFLLMDLHFRGLDAHGNTVFNRYFDDLAEEDGLAAFPLFLSLRAAIRSQVAAAAARNAHQPAAAPAHALRARKLLGTAVDLAAPPPAQLIAIGGLSGTGKSTLAYRLAPLVAKAPGARVLRSDVLRKRRAGLRAEARLPPGAYEPAARQANYEALLVVIATCLRSGQTVIADAVFPSSPERAAIEQLAKNAGVRFRGLWLDAPRAALEQRLHARTGDASDATAEVLPSQLSHHTVPADWLRVNAGAAAEATAQKALSLLALSDGTNVAPVP